MAASTFCDHCGMALYSDDVYCVGCGNPTNPAPGNEAQRRPERRSTRVVLALKTGSHGFLTACVRCGGEVLPGDAYCQLCGARLPRDV